MRTALVLHFMPPQDLDHAVDELSQELRAELQPVFMGRVNRRGRERRPPLFPIALWNMHQ